MEIIPKIEAQRYFTDSERALIFEMVVFFLEANGDKNEYFKVTWSANELHDAKSILKKCE